MSDTDKRYGERLAIAKAHKEKTSGRSVSNQEVANAAESGMSRQNIGQIINGTKGGDQKLGLVAHLKVARFLRVNPEWLATGEGDMLKGVQPEPQPLTGEIAGLMAIVNSIHKDKRTAALLDATLALTRYLPASTAASLELSSIELPQANAPVAKASATPHR